MKRSLFILIDALGWKKISETGFLPELAGTRCPLKTVLAYSGGCQSALFSGKPPGETGHWLMYYFAEAGRTFEAARWLRPFPDWIRERGRVRRWLRNRIQKEGRIRAYYSLYHVPVGALPYMELADQEDLYAPGGLAPVRSIFDDLAENGTPHAVWTWRVSEEESLSQLLDEVRENRNRFYVVYWTRLDALMHQNGTRADAVDAHIGWYEEAIRRILKEGARTGDEWRLFIFSDHGMIDTRDSLDLMGPIAELGLRYGKDYLAFYDSTLARFSFFSGRARAEISALLREQEVGTILDDETLRTLGIFFEDHRYGEMIFLTRPGTLIVPSYMGSEPARAMHGFHPDAPGSDAVLVSNVDLGRTLESVMDMYPLMREELSG